MTTQKNSTFFSIDLTVGNWRWWFGVVILLVSTLGMVLLAAEHHVLLVIVLLTTLMLSLAVKPNIITTHDYGLVLKNLPKLMVWVCCAVALFAGLVYWFEHSSPEALHASRQVIESLNFGENYKRDLLLVLTICVFAPLNEEFIYRGVIFRGIWNSLLKQHHLNLGSPTQKKWFGFTIATVVSGFLFMSAHGGEGQDTQIYMILLLGVIACGLYALTGSLLASILFHSLNNTIALWQSLHAGHMTFTTQAGALPLNILMYFSPIVTLLLSWLIWACIRLLQQK